MNYLLRNFHRCKDLNSKWPLQNFMKIGSEFTEKSTKFMRSWFNVTLGMVY